MPFLLTFEEPYETDPQNKRGEKMGTYVFKNLKAQFTKQRLLSLLLVLNIVVSCLVICFSYGLYQNYNMVLQEGEEEELSMLEVFIDSENADFLYDYNLIAYSSVTPQMITDLTKELYENLNGNFASVQCDVIIDSPFFVFLCENEGEFVGTSSVDPEELDDFYYDDSFEPFYTKLTCEVSYDGEKIIDAYGDKYFTEDQYNNGDKVVVVADECFDERCHQYITFNTPILSTMYIDGFRRILPEGTESIIIGGDRYDIISVLPKKDMPQNFTYMRLPITSLPESAVISAEFFSSLEGKSAQCFIIHLNEPVTRSQYEAIQSCLSSVMGDTVYLQPMEFTDATEIYYYKTVMLISVFIAVLAAINMAILYRYILEKRSRELAVFRICGCSKGKASASYLLECLLINAPLFALTQLLYHKLIMPRLTGLFPNMAGAYSFKLYAAIFGIYIAASMLVMITMILFTVRRHSLVALKSAPRSANKFGIMKVFEVVQLSAVLSMIVLIVSAVMSRYGMYTPFEQYLSRRGYMVLNNSPTIYADEFENTIGNADCIMNNMAWAYDGDTQFTNIIYSDEFIDAYAPPLEDGVWLSDTDITFEGTGYIPVVITSCEGRYKVGDTFEFENTTYDNDGNVVNVTTAGYRIIGVLKDKVSIASYMLDNFSPYNYTDIYSVFSDSYEDDDYILSRASDAIACFGGNGPVHGVQFVFCDSMTDAEYKDMGIRVNSGTLTAAPLSEVNEHSLNYIYEQMYTLFPIAVCIFILTMISTVSISAIYTKRQLRNYAIFYICGARWRTCALRSLKNGVITCVVSTVISALILTVGKATLFKETVITLGVWQLCAAGAVIVLYLALSMVMPLSVIGSAEPREVLKEE